LLKVGGGRSRLGLAVKGRVEDALGVDDGEEEEHVAQHGEKYVVDDVDFGSAGRRSRE